MSPANKDIQVRVRIDIDRYMRAWGHTLASMADASGTPRDKLAVDPWWYPNPNPMPYLDLFPRLTRMLRRYRR